MQLTKPNACSRAEAFGVSGALPLFVFRLKMKNPVSSLFAEISSI